MGHLTKEKTMPAVLIIMLGCSGPGYSGSGLLGASVKLISH